MSYDPEVLKRLDELCEIYQKRWGKAVDLVGCPGFLTQEMLVRILERTVDTGESIIVGFDHLLEAEDDRENRLMKKRI